MYRKKRIKYMDAKEYLPYIILIVIFVTLIIRNRYSFCWSDESLYVSNMYRLYQGDVFLKDDWNKTMLSSYVTLPLFYIYMMVKGSTEGVYLFFRDVMVVLAFADAMAVYHVIYRHFSKMAALTCSICILIYSRANICGISYYNTGMHLFVLAACIYYFTDFTAAEDTENILFAAFGGGICLGLSIVVNPYILIVFPVLFLVYVKRRRKSTLMAGLGCVLYGMVFVFCYLRSIGISKISDVVGNLHYVEEAAVWSRFFSWFALGMHFFRQTFLIQCMILFVQLFLTKVKIKYGRQIQIVMFFASAACLGINLYHSTKLLGGAYIAFTMFGLQILPAVWKQSGSVDRKGMIYFYVTGILLSIAYEIASNNGIDAAGIGFAVASFGAVLTLSKYQVPAGRILQNFVRGVKWLSLACVIGITLFLRIFAVYRDDRLPQLQYKIAQGPAKGIYTTQDHLEQYNNVCEDIHTCVENNPNKSIFVTKLAAWAYLCTEARCAAYQTWRTSFSDPLLETYFLDHPEPDYILILKNDYGGFWDNYIVTWGEDGDQMPNTNDISGYLLNYILENGYRRIPVKSGILYQKM